MAQVQLKMLGRYYLCGRQSHSGLMIDCKCVFDVGQCSIFTTSKSTSVFSSQQTKHANSGMWVFPHLCVCVFLGWQWKCLEGFKLSFEHVIGFLHLIHTPLCTYAGSYNLWLAAQSWTNLTNLLKTLVNCFTGQGAKQTVLKRQVKPSTCPLVSFRKHQNIWHFLKIGYKRGSEFFLYIYWIYAFVHLFICLFKQISWSKSWADLYCNY